MIELLNTIMPEWTQILKVRQTILAELSQKVMGRRLLAEKINLPESFVRKEIDLLKDQGLLESTSRGMELTPKGHRVLEDLQAFINSERAVHFKEKALAEHLKIHQAVIVAGDSEEDPRVLQGMGARAVQVLDEVLPEGKSIIAVTGGTSVAAVGDQMTESLAENRQLIFIPGRGGVGEGMHIQANSVSATMARKTKQKSYALYTPDQMGQEAKMYLKEEPEVKTVVDLMNQANVFIFGIGDASTMASRRNLKEDTLDILQEKEAIGEVFGEYFNCRGEKVYEITRIGLTSEDLKNINYPLAVAGGKDKAEAIEAYLKNAPDHLLLVTDEAAAEAILKEKIK